MSIYSGKVLGFHRARAELAIHDLKKELDKRATRQERLALIREWFATAIASRIAPNKRTGDGISVRESEAYLKAKDVVAAYFKDDYVFDERHWFWPSAGVFRKYLRRKMNGADEAWEKVYLGKAVEAYDETVPLLYGTGLPLSLSTSIKQTFAREEYLDAIKGEMRAVVREGRMAIPVEGEPTRNTTPGFAVLTEIREVIRTGSVLILKLGEMMETLVGKESSAPMLDQIKQVTYCDFWGHGWALVLAEEYEKRVVDAQLCKVIDKAFAKAHNRGGQYLPVMADFPFYDVTEDVGRLVDDDNAVSFGLFVQKQERKIMSVLRRCKILMAVRAIGQIIRREQPREELYAYDKQMLWHVPQELEQVR